MADQEKLIIEVDVETGQAKVKLGDLQSTVQKTGKEGSSAFDSIGLKATFFNQALELGEKLLDGMRVALDTIEKSEGLNNQRTALLALAQSAGLSVKQVGILVDTIKLSSGETLTTAQATKAAFDLLNSGVKAQNIPTMIQFAERLSEVRPQIGGIENAIYLVSNAMERGTTRGLSPYIDGLKITGSRQETLNAIIEQNKKLIQQTGDGYENFGKKVKASMSESYDAKVGFFGSLFREGGITFFGTEAERAALNMKKLKDQLADVERMQAKSDSPRLQAEKKFILEQIEKQQGNVNQATQKESELIEKNTQLLTQQGTVKKTLDPSTQNKARLEANFQLYAELESQDEAYVQHSEMIEKGLMNAKKQMIEQEYRDQLARLNSTITDRRRYVQAVVNLEREKVRQIQALEQVNQRTQILSSRNIAAGWRSAMKQMEQDWSSWSRTSQKMAVQTHSVMASSITKMAKEHRFAMDEMLNNFLAMIGETLIQKGTADLLMALFPFNPGGLAIGAAEIAAGAALVGATSGGTSAPAPTIGGSIGADLGNQANLIGPAVKEKQASIIINGDFLNSQETANHLQEIIRKNSDITDYAIVAQGKQY